MMNPYDPMAPIMMPGFPSFPQRKSNSALGEAMMFPTDMMPSEESLAMHGQGPPFPHGYAFHNGYTFPPLPGQHQTQDGRAGPSENDKGKENSKDGNHTETQRNAVSKEHMSRILNEAVATSE